MKTLPFLKIIPWLAVLCCILVSSQAFALRVGTVKHDTPRYKNSRDGLVEYQIVPAGEKVIVSDEYVEEILYSYLSLIFRKTDPWPLGGQKVGFICAEMVIT